MRITEKHLLAARNFFNYHLTCNSICLCNYLRVRVLCTPILPRAIHWILILCLFFFFCASTFSFHSVFSYVFVQHLLIRYFCQHDQGSLKINYYCESMSELITEVIKGTNGLRMLGLTVEKQGHVNVREYREVQISLRDIQLCMLCNTFIFKHRHAMK